MTASPDEAAARPAGPRPGHEQGTAPTPGTTPRRFLVETLPPLMWLLERRMTVAWWDLGAGWVLRIQQHRTGPGPVSIAAVQRADDHDAATYHWFAPEAPERVARAELLLDDVMRSRAAHRNEKTRRGCMLAGVWWEFDEFHGRHEGLVIAESERAADSETWITSEWLGREVTGEPGYDERALAGESREP